MSYSYKNNKILFIALAVSVISGCSISPIAPRVDVQDPVVPGVVSKNPVTNFKNEVITQGINLSESDMKMVRDLQAVRPVGRWATSDTISPKENMENNFNQFKTSLAPNGPETSEDYMLKAIQFANSVNYYSKYYFDTEYYKQKQKVLLVKWDPQTKEFIVIHIDGRVSNYQKTDSIGAPRYIIVPDEFSVQG